ncbi:hypothetical protein [Roseivirga pacifica]
MKSKIGKGAVLYFEPEKSRPEIQFGEQDFEERLFIYHNFNRLWFSYDLAEKNEEEINNYLDLNLRVYKRRGGEDFEDWFSVLKENVPMSFTSRQRDAFYSWVEQNESNYLNAQVGKKRTGEVSTISYFIDILGQTNIFPFKPYEHDSYKAFVKKACNHYSFEYSKRVENSKDQRNYQKYRKNVLNLAKEKLTEIEFEEFKRKLEENIS